MKISNSFDIMQKSLLFRRIRQDLIASNIANADTPFYKARDIRFEDALKEAKNKNKLALAKTNPKHLDPKDLASKEPIIFFRDGHLQRNDGNSVDIDIEMSEMAKNATAYNATVAAIKKEIELFKTVIDSTKNL